MTTVDKLKRMTVKDLAQMAKRKGVEGWHSMRKDQLVRALSRARRKTNSRATVKASAKSRNSNGSTRTSRRATTAKSTSRASAKPTSQSSAKKNGAAKKPTRKAPAVERRLKKAKANTQRLKDLAQTNGRRRGFDRDRLVVMVRDPFWLHAYWELTRQGIERAEAALGHHWHSARPVLRLLEIGGGSTKSASETVIRHIDIHGGVNNWYVDVQDPPKKYRLDIGYLAEDGKFFLLARSNIVSTPRAGSADSIDENWSDVAKNFEKVYALSGGRSSEGASPELQELFEERLRRPMSSPIIARGGAAAMLTQAKREEFAFDLDAELIIYGNTEADAHVTLQGDPVELRGDGSFTVRFSLPNCRQVIPAVAQSADGIEQRTIVLAIERNTKVMEPVVREAHE